MTPGKFLGCDGGMSCAALEMSERVWEEDKTGF